MRIKFSHHYPKLHEQRTEILLRVEIREKKELCNEFIFYDTRYYLEHGKDGEKGYFYYLLPDVKLLCLVFLGNDLIPFTTVRRWTSEKAKFYNGAIGQLFTIEYVN
jgi:hypothetical protein